MASLPNREQEIIPSENEEMRSKNRGSSRNDGHCIVVSSVEMHVTTFGCPVFDLLRNTPSLSILKKADHKLNLRVVQLEYLLSTGIEMLPIEEDHFDRYRLGKSSFPTILCLLGMNLPEVSSQKI